MEAQPLKPRLMNLCTISIGCLSQLNFWQMLRIELRVDQPYIQVQY